MCWQCYAFVLLQLRNEKSDFIIPRTVVFAVVRRTLQILAWTEVLTTFENKCVLIMKIFVRVSQCKL